MKCGCCGEEIYLNGKCQVSGCGNGAMYEGWYDVKDGFGIPTGLSRILRVCEEHKKMLRENKNVG